MNEPIPSETARARGGFTLTELLAAVTILVIVMMGVLTIYLTYQRSWVVTTLARSTSNDASMALERIVYGMGNDGGLRAAEENGVALSFPSGGWLLNYSSNKWIQFTPGSEEIVNELGDVLCENVVESTASETNRGFLIMLSVAENAGQHSATNTMMSFVEFRN